MQFPKKGVFVKYPFDHEYFVLLKVSKMKLFPKIRDFLESSTIHGLVHISTGKNVFIRCIWGMIVIACFSCGLYMIESAVESWVDNPVVTSVDTKAIEQVLRSPLAKNLPLTKYSLLTGSLARNHSLSSSGHQHRLEP